MISLQDAMIFLQSDEEPRDINEQMILNNRHVCNFISGNLYNPIDEAYISKLVCILTERMDNGGGNYRKSDTHEIPCMNDESYEVPPAKLIPEKMQELICFLQNKNVHPLIKAGIAQAWILLIRPFDEGNERLGRLLSTVILLRSGYTFFGDVSLSSIIARQSYEYFSAMANIMRTENGDDLTYFLEYFLGLLARALDERKMRIAKRLARAREEERKMAMQPLSEENIWEELPLDSMQNRLSYMEEESPDPSETNPSFKPYPAEDIPSKGCEPANKETEHSPEENSEGVADDILPPTTGWKGGDVRNLKAKLEEMKSRSPKMLPIADILEHLLNNGITTFTRAQLLDGLNFSSSQVEDIFSKLRDFGIIGTSHWECKKKVYCFTGQASSITQG